MTKRKRKDVEGRVGYVTLSNRVFSNRVLRTQIAYDPSTERLGTCRKHSIW